MIVLSLAAFLLTAQSVESPVEPAKTAMSLRLIRPDHALETLLGLFDQTAVKSPAAALARWRAATGRAEVLDKTAQAVIAVLNPEMARELAALDGASAHFRLDADGTLQWHLAIPRDDGAFAAFATATALTEGGAEAPLEPSGAQVDRLDRDGRVLSARLGSSLVFGSSRLELASGLKEISLPPKSPPVHDHPCWIAEIDPAALQTARQEPLRTVAAILHALAATSLYAEGALETDVLSVRFQTNLAGAAASCAPVRAEWLQPVPDHAAGAFALALDRSGEVVSALYRLGDALQKPRAPGERPAPLRTRVNTLAAAAGLFPELELWPRLDGVSGWLALGRDKVVDSCAIFLHFHDTRSAEALAHRLTARAALLLKTTGPPQSTLYPKRAGTLATGKVVATLHGRPVGILLRGATLAVTWGEGALASTRASWQGETPRAFPEIEKVIAARRPQRLAAIWPGRLLAGSRGTLRLAVETAPILWSGTTNGAALDDWIEWSNLRATVKAVVDALPPLPGPEPRS
jgi:hypothetical protein